MAKPPLTILLAAPRGFCAGVERAIRIVEGLLDRYGAPVFVRHEIVHNRFVVAGLESKGAVFVEDLGQVPDDRPVVFSAHGVPKWVVADAERRGLFHVDAACPLVGKVHREAERHYAAGRQVLLIGHAGHPEVIGTMGQLPPGAVTLVESLAQAETLPVPDPEQVAYVTQTTLSVGETAGIVAALRRRFPAIAVPRGEDICYATTNRQVAVRALAARVDALIVLGAPNSSNANRLAEVGRAAGCRASFLVQRAAEIDWNGLAGITALGVTAGASTPEVLVQEVLTAARTRFEVRVEEVRTAQEDISFRLPRLAAMPA